VSNTITFYIKPKPDKYLFPLFPPSLSLLLKACLLSVDIAVRFYGERYDIIFIKLPLNFSRESKWVSLTDAFTINGHAENHEILVDSAEELYKHPYRQYYLSR